jgi:electron transport complex protein RnfD
MRRVQKAMSDTKFVVSTSPHIRDRENIPRIMWRVNLILAPAAIMGIVFFGWDAAVMLAVCIAGSVGTEALIQKLVGKKITVNDGSAFLTGMLLAMVVSPAIVHPTPEVVAKYASSLSAPIATLFAMNLYVPLIGAFFAIAFAKQMFGGLGCNIWNPALAGRAFMLAAYALLGTGVWSNIEQIKYPSTEQGGKMEVAATTGATTRNFKKTLIRDSRESKGYFAQDAQSKQETDPRARLEQIDNMVYERKQVEETRSTAPQATAGGKSRFYLKFLLGYRDGSLGETCSLWLIIGGIILIALKYIDWRVPVFYIGTAVFLGWALPVKVLSNAPPVWFGGNPLFDALSGGLLIGAFFMATDMVTSPITKKGNVIFGIGCGLLTALIRTYGGYPEGVCYSILLMNTAVPLIDRFTRPRVFGTKIETAAQR